nr:MAG TPA: hypothetical protein [Caudoviricetes sp.]DAW32076.1 MAG TPA: hypothetical protein [Caudoviricetes sp.]
MDLLHFLSFRVDILILFIYLPTNSLIADFRR